MSATKEHYDTLLASHYSWSRGPFSDQVANSKVFFEGRDILPKHPKDLAIDLGCGAGAQSLALAALGFQVMAVDQCAKLLEELQERCSKDAPIQTVQSDLMDFTEHSPSSPSLIACMGDTLTHLDSHEAVTTLFTRCNEALQVDGHLVLTYRDLSGTLKGLDRFIPVRSDSERIFTCFLEYLEDVVMVHDLVYEKQGDEWVLTRSAYPKLRLSTDWVRASLKSAGMQVVECTNSRGMVSLVATRG